MSIQSKQQLGAQKNKLLRYSDIIALYQEKRKENKWMPTTAIHAEFIYPRFRISRATLYEALRTPVIKELQKLAEIENAQMQLSF
jgi:hypothetical protein